MATWAGIEKSLNNVVNGLERWDRKYNPASWNEIEKNVTGAACKLEKIGAKYSNRIRKAQFMARHGHIGRRTPFIVEDASNLPPNRNIDRCISAKGLSGFEVSLPCKSCGDHICLD
jgi:hypothetical protein